MEENFVDALMREKQHAKMRFEFPQQPKPLAEIFGFIEVSEKALESRICVALCVFSPIFPFTVLW